MILSGVIALSKKEYDRLKFFLGSNIEIIDMKESMKDFPGIQYSGPVEGIVLRFPHSESQMIFIEE